MLKYKWHRKNRHPSPNTAYTAHFVRPNSAFGERRICWERYTNNKLTEPIK